LREAKTISWLIDLGMKVIPQAYSWLYEHITKSKKQRNSRWENAFSEFCSIHKGANAQGRCWCIMWFSFPVRYFDGEKKISSDQIEQLKTAMENHEIEGERIWLKKFASLSCIENSHLQRWEQGVSFCSQSISSNISDPKKGIHFRIWFDARGFIFSYIGFPWTSNKISAEKVCAAFYSMLELILQRDINEYYLTKKPSKKDEYVIITQIDQFPGGFEASWDSQELSSKIIPEGSSLGCRCKQKKVKVKDFNPQTITKEYMSEYLAEAGCMHYEKNLSEFDIKKWLSHF